MQTKLTLRLDDALVTQAKHYAAREGRSVSALVADYFQRLQGGGETSKQATPQTRRSSFHGLLAKTPLAQLSEAALMQRYRDHMIAKHL